MKNMTKMLIPGPICSIRARGGKGSRQISPFLTSETDSTGQKPKDINPQIACDIPSTFWTPLTEDANFGL